MKLIYILMMFCSILGKANELKETPSVAFLAMSDAAEKWVSLYVGTREMDGAVLLERGAADALRKERSVFLQASGETNADFDLRNWVSADVLVVVETIEGKDKSGEADLLWFRALDVVTGVRLVDEILAVDLSRPEKGLVEVEKLLQELLLPSWRNLWAEEKSFAGVSLMDIRLVDAGLEDRQTFSSLYRMLQHMIVKDPSMILMERNRLELLRAEEALSPGLNLKLQSGLVLVSGSVHQEVEGAVFTLRGTSSANQIFFQETFVLDGKVGPDDLASRAMDLLSQHFNFPQQVREKNLEQEAKRYHQLARYYFSRKKLEPALDAAFSALALSPESAPFTHSLYSIYYAKVMAEILNLKNPDVPELSKLLNRIYELMGYHTSVPLFPHQGDSGKHLMGSATTRFGDLIQSDAELQAQWQAIEAVYHRSLEKVYHRERFSKSNPTDEDRDAFIRSLLLTARPLVSTNFNYIFEVDRRGRRHWSTPLPLEDLLQLMEIMEKRPYVSWNPNRKGKRFIDPVLRDLYNRYMVLAVLRFVAGGYDEIWKEKSLDAMRQFAWLIVQNPSLWTQNNYAIIEFVSVEFSSALQEVFREVRNEIEAEGWFVPELYFLEELSMSDTVMKKAVNPALRLLSTADKAEQFLSEDQELVKRLEVWRDPEDGYWKANSESTTQSVELKYDDIVIDNWKRFLGANWHCKSWGGFLVAPVQQRPIDEFAEETLEVYQKTVEGVQKVKTLRFPHSDVEVRIDDANDKRFYQVLLGGKQHLYYSHQHVLYQFDEEMNQIRVLKLKDLGFPDYMVSNLLETPQGLFLSLSKPHYQKHFDLNGRATSASHKNNGGVFLLMNDQLELKKLIANIERPTPQNDLEKHGPFDAETFYEGPGGKIIFNSYLQSSSWFEVGEDFVPIKRKRPPHKELVGAWVSSFGMNPEWDLDFMKTFCLGDGKSFGLSDRYKPGSRMDCSFQFRRIVPFGKGLILMKAGRGGPDLGILNGLYYIPHPSEGGEVQHLMKFTDKELFDSLILWGEDLVITGRNPRHRVIRKDAIEAYVSGAVKSHSAGAFPSRQYLTEQAFYLKEKGKRVIPYQVPEVLPGKSPSLDHLVKVPGGRFSLHPRKENPALHPEVRFEDFYMSDTLVTHEEFWRVLNWAIYNGYRFSNTPEFSGYLDKLHHMPTRPEVDIQIVDALLYCNARSEMEGMKPAYYLDAAHQKVLRSGYKNNIYDRRWKSEYVDWNAGYRLPTEAEWEYVARGCDENHTSRYPWGDTISHAQANYLATDFYRYDRSSGGLHPMVAGQHPPVSPVKTFPPRGFENRFYDLVGNAAEIVWDRREWELPGAETKIPGSALLYKGGGWADTANDCSIRSSTRSIRKVINHGFRVVAP
ncbi:SUMF1/EgtB/PvdO family nonheme iron enzyme [Kiritimatiellaeota bacterium B1221]|nr:SUMF1/EgtB/PvdO family nonheme iron enzyme [Kiritimatiellaeota bacterium B1221]